jgi:hypothetical protein
MRWLRLGALAAISLASGTSSAASLSPGPVSHPPGAKLGEPVVFENEITDNRCYPLITRKGLVLLWLSAMHEFDSRVLVRRCVEYDPRISVPAGRRHGDSRVEWEELRFADPDSFPIASELELPGYQYFSNPSFCKSKVAYWIQDDHRWSVTIYDLAKSHVVATQFIRRDGLETDNPGHFEMPKWGDGCTKVSVSDHPPIEAK